MAFLSFSFARKSFYLLTVHCLSEVGAASAASGARTSPNRTRVPSPTPLHDNILTKPECGLAREIVSIARRNSRYRSWLRMSGLGLNPGLISVMAGRLGTGMELQIGVGIYTSHHVGMAVGWRCLQ